MMQYAMQTFLKTQCPMSARMETNYTDFVAFAENFL